MPDEQVPGPPPPQSTASQPIGQPAARPQYQQAPPGGIVQSIIPTSNPPALLSYYCGIFSIAIPFAPILSPIAIVSGIKGMKRIKAQPGLKGWGHALAGIIIGSITGLIALAIIGSIVYSVASAPPTGAVKIPPPHHRPKPAR